MSEELSKYEKIKISKENIENKNFKLFFFVPDLNGQPSVAVSEIYTHVKTLIEHGYDASLLTENSKYVMPEFLDDNLKLLPHTNSEDNINVKPEDFLIIPEFFANVMQQTKDLPCSRIVIAQSYDLTLNALVPGTTWKDYGIRNVLATSDKMKDFLNGIFQSLNIKTYTIGIPDYFKASDKPKQPIIACVSRNVNDLNKILKLFYIKYPQFNWVTFDDMRNMINGVPHPITREEFAERLGKTCLSVWIDRIAGFGTFPVEAMKCGSFPIGLIPDVSPEYIVENSGIWTDNIYQIPDLLAEMIKRFLEDIIPIEVSDKMKEVSSKYNEENFKSTVIKSYEEFFAERILTFQNAMNNETTQTIPENFVPIMEVNKSEE